MRPLLLIILSVACFSVLSELASAGPIQKAHINRERATCWKYPGYSWRDCGDFGRSIPSENERYPNYSAPEGIQIACQNRQAFPEAGDRVIIQQDANGKLRIATRPIFIRGEVQNKNFYQVETRNSKGENVTCWIEAEQLTQPEPLETNEPKHPGKIEVPKEPELPKPLPEEPPCPPAESKETPKRRQKEAQDIVDHTRSAHFALGETTKSDREINYYMCLHRDNRVNAQQFRQMLPRFQKSAKAAEASFGVNYGLTMCTLLVESGLHFIKNENDEYTGYGQFGSAIIEDLTNLAEKNKAYGAMVSSYQTRMSGSGVRPQFTDKKIRDSSDPEHATGAVALAMKWLYEQRLPAQCRQCTPRNGIDRKELYLMVAGYNYSPFGLKPLANRSLASLRTTFPPPKETRNYMEQVERCLDKDQNSKFRVAAGAGYLKTRERECASMKPGN